MLQHARALFSTEETKGLQSLVARKIEGIRHFDLAAMEKVVGTVPGGRSRSFLLYSYFDGHDDVTMGDRSTIDNRRCESPSPTSL
jgi:hypothetical protein